MNINYNNQIICASNSIIASYRAVGRVNSTADFIRKLKIVEKELNEMLLFLEMLYEFNPVHKEKFICLYKNGK